MHMTKYMFDALFARDMLVKMQYGSSMDIVRMHKITVHYTSQYMLQDMTHMLLPCVAIQLLTGQTPYVTRAKQSVASYKLKKHQVIGCAVTLREARMYAFFTQCVHVMAPRNTAFALLPVYALQPTVHFGVTQLLFFPSLEKHVDIFEALEGCAIHVHTTARTHVETRLLCSGLTLPSMDGAT